jgi:hypothetical protein
MSATEAATPGKRFFRFKFILPLSKRRPSARKNCGLLLAAHQINHFKAQNLEA